MLLICFKLAKRWEEFLKWFSLGLHTVGIRKENQLTGFWLLFSVPGTCARYVEIALDGRKCHVDSEDLVVKKYYKVKFSSIFESFWVHFKVSSSCQLKIFSCICIKGHDISADRTELWLYCRWKDKFVDGTFFRMWFNSEVPKHSCLLEAKVWNLFVVCVPFVQASVNS